MASNGRMGMQVTILPQWDRYTSMFQWPVKAGWGFRPSPFIPGRQGGQVSMASKGRMGIQADSLLNQRRPGALVSMASKGRMGIQERTHA